MFLWQDKLSCNGSFKLVCQVHGSGSIILIRHLHILSAVSRASFAVYIGHVHLHFKTLTNVTQSLAQLAIRHVTNYNPCVRHIRDNLAQDELTVQCLLCLA